jgi:hypothetical protein
MSVASKNSVVVGYVAYFVGLSLMGLMIYCWSQPPHEGTRLGNSRTSSTPSSGVLVEYENLGTEASVLNTVIPVEEPSELDTPAATEATDVDEWR